MLCVKRCEYISEQLSPVLIRQNLPLAKFLSQVKESGGPISIEILAQAKAKEPQNDSMTRFLERYVSHKRVGTLPKETHTGKVATEWAQKVEKSAEKCDKVDISIAISAIMAPKDDDELVSIGIKRMSYHMVYLGV